MTHMGRLSRTGSVAVLLLCILCLESIGLGSSTAVFEPEIQDGIPVLSARTLYPARRWDDDLDDHTGGGSGASDLARTGVVVQPLASGRRDSLDANAADADNFENDNEDEEDNEREEQAPAGTNRQQSFTEDPAFGESRSAANDANDIESFFDRHLGPPGRNEPEPAASEQHDNMLAAGSSPLINIFHSILNAHKRPLVITTTSADDNSTATDSSSAADSAQSSASSSAPAPNGSAYGLHSAAALPFGYFAPLAVAPSTMTVYEQPGQGSDAEVADGGGVREIYITRRPHGTQLAIGKAARVRPSSPSSASTAAYWRQQPAQAGLQPYGQSADYSQYPVAASYAYQRGQQASGMAQAAAPAADEEQTVTFGLSFGRRPEAEESTAVDEEAEPAGYPAFGARGQPVRESSRAYNNYYYAPQPAALMMRPVAYPNHQMEPQQTAQQQQQQQQQQMQYRNQQQAYEGARYHKDPSEHQSGYDQYSNEPKSAARQHLLASLDKQLKTSALYNPDVGDQSQRLLARSPPPSSFGDGPSFPSDLELYNSFHAEFDPNGGLTRAAKLVNGPPPNLPQGQSDAHQEPPQASRLERGQAADVRPNLRVRREDTDEREMDDDADDGVWVDDDDDDDSRHQSSDLNETAQDPSEEEEEESQSIQPVPELPEPAKPVGVHGYELAPDDLLMYRG